MRTLTYHPIGTEGGIYFNAKPVSENDKLTAGLIWKNISSFVKSREKAYHALIAQGIEVPDFARKQNAIKMLHYQLDASKEWSLIAQVRWINAMRQLIAELLPKKEDRFRASRRKMIYLLNYCDTLLQEQNRLPFMIAASKESKV